MRLLVFGMSPAYGGTEAVVYSILKDLLRKGVCFDFANTFASPLAREVWLHSLGCQVLSLNLKKRGRYLKYREGLKRFFGRHSKEYDGIWINLQEPDGAEILSFAKKAGIKTRLVTAHSSKNCSRSGLVRRAMIRWSRRSILRNATRCVAVSSKAKIYTFGKNAGATIIRSGIDVNRFSFSLADRTAIRNEYGIDDDEPLIVCVGRLTSQKNFSFAIDILNQAKKKSPGVRMIVVGDGEERQVLIEKTRQNHLDSAVLFAGNTINVHAFLSAADYFVFPSTAEGLGMVLIEAQCSGLPCFASDGPIPKEAQVTSLVTWLPLNKGPAFWAETILATPINKNREGYDKKLQELGLDYQTVAQKYYSLFTE